MKLRIGLKNFKGVFAHVWFNIAAFLSLQLRSTLPRWKSLCHSWSRDQPQPGSMEAVDREPGNEVVITLRDAQDNGPF